jgi:hypothetical protein
VISVEIISAGRASRGRTLGKKRALLESWHTYSCWRSRAAGIAARASRCRTYKKKRSLLESWHTYAHATSVVEKHLCIKWHYIYKRLAKKEGEKMSVWLLLWRRWQCAVTRRQTLLKAAYTSNLRVLRLLWRRWQCAMARRQTLLKAAYTSNLRVLRLIHARQLALFEGWWEQAVRARRKEQAIRTFQAERASHQHLPALFEGWWEEAVRARRKEQAFSTRTFQLLTKKQKRSAAAARIAFNIWQLRATRSRQLRRGGGQLARRVCSRMLTYAVCSYADVC